MPHFLELNRKLGMKRNEYTRDCFLGIHEFTLDLMPLSEYLSVNPAGGMSEA